jgi:4-diphosphocytidyl-2-C-methyl-D-erythritol kinase
VNVERLGDAVRVLAPAKVNLFLELHGRRPDGFHEIETVMQAVGLYDELLVRAVDAPGVTLSCSDPSLPSGHENLAHRAAVALDEEMGLPAGVAIELIKRIPAGGGLAGGSSDAAGVLAGVNELFGLGLSARSLHDLAAKLGSDVAFFTQRGVALCTGRGEIVRPVESRLDAFVVICCPPVRVSTAEAYRAAGTMGLTVGDRDASFMLKSLAQGNLASVRAAQFNRFEPVAVALAVAVKGAKAALAAVGEAPSLVSGSGASVYALFEAEAEALDVAAKLRTRAVGEVFVVPTVR